MLLLASPRLGRRLLAVVVVCAALATLLVVARAEYAAVFDKAPPDHRNGNSNVNSDYVNNNVNYIKNNDAPPIPTVQIGRDVHGRPVRLPLLGAGTWQYNETTAYDSLCQALSTAAYTLVDTALGYHNQKGVGRALHDCGNRAANVFVLTKIPGGLSRQETLAAHAQNLWQLNVQQVDHLMVHYPADWKQEKASKAIRQEQWRALEEIWFSGKARSIGVSHYCPQHLADILEIATVPPSLNQVEYHVGSGDIDGVREFCRRNQIYFMSFSPLCGPCDSVPSDSLITGDLVATIGQAYNKTGAQVSLRFIVQQALQNGTYMAGVIPKSNNLAHMQANRDIFEWSLTEADMAKLHGATKPAAEAGDCNVL
jgi:diketogulonate reductase-like aldo/keto reductase